MPDAPPNANANADTDIDLDAPFFDPLPAAHVRPTAELLKALSDENRLRILAMLSTGECCVCHIVEALGLSQPNVSQHLTVLRRAGVVEGERRGAWMYYRWSDALPASQARIVAVVLAGVLEERSDREALAAARQRVVCG